MQAIDLPPRKTSPAFRATSMTPPCASRAVARQFQRRLPHGDSCKCDATPVPRTRMSSTRICAEHAQGQQIGSKREICAEKRRRQRNNETAGKSSKDREEGVEGRVDSIWKF
eukprot:1631865-Pleurochrysis_carterae.AAC.1